MLRVSVGSAWLAKKRHLDAATIGPRKKASMAMTCSLERLDKESRAIVSRPLLQANDVIWQVEAKPVLLAAVHESESGT